MATHSSTLAWKIPWMEEPGGLQSMGSLRVRHDWTTSLSLFTFMHWRSKWQPTPVFLPGESQGLGSLVGCRLWGRTESDMTDATLQQQPWFSTSGELSVSSMGYYYNLCWRYGPWFVCIVWVPKNCLALGPAFQPVLRSVVTIRYYNSLGSSSLLFLAVSPNSS